MKLGLIEHLLDHASGCETEGNPISLSKLRILHQPINQRSEAVPLAIGQTFDLGNAMENPCRLTRSTCAKTIDPPLFGNDQEFPVGRQHVMHRPLDIRHPSRLPLTLCAPHIIGGHLAFFCGIHPVPRLDEDLGRAVLGLDGELSFADVVPDLLLFALAVSQRLLVDLRSCAPSVNRVLILKHQRVAIRHPRVLVRYPLPSFHAVCSVRHEVEVTPGHHVMTPVLLVENEVLHPPGREIEHRRRRAPARHHQVSARYRKVTLWNHRGKRRGAVRLHRVVHPVAAVGPDDLPAHRVHRMDEYPHEGPDAGAKIHPSVTHNRATPCRPARDQPVAAEHLPLRRTAVHLPVKCPGIGTDTIEMAVI